MLPRKRSSTMQLCRGANVLRVAGMVVAVAGAAGTSGASAKEGPKEGGKRAPSEDGGAVYVPQPQISEITCLRRCATRRRAQQGSTVRVIGKALSQVKRLTFHGTTGSGDDVQAKVRPGADRRLNVVVPMGAVSGPVSATAAGARSKLTRPLSILPAPPPEPNPTLTPVSGPRQRGAPRLETGTSRTKAFYGAKRTVTFSYRISGGSPASVQVQLIRATDGAVVRKWTPRASADSVEKVAWNGKTGGQIAARGRYAFRLTVAGDRGEQAHSARAQDFSRDAFDLYDHVFPIRGTHDYGGPGARFGSGRGGRSHQGHDVFARCGTPMVAARGGRVKFSGYHSAAGNYLVIDGEGTGIDYSYMHMVSPSAFRRGDRVFTGQRIGEVGDSGNASGCHLHYEMWGPPGWYAGGQPFDPLPSLRAWDAWS